jgi:opacity protein-like surface antigen
MTSKTKAKARNRGISSVFTAVIMALTIAAVIAAIAVSWPMIKSNFDKSSWAGSMSLYKVGFAYTKNGPYAYAQNGVSAPLSSSPSPVGYCLAYQVNATTAIYSCPSNQPAG